METRTFNKRKIINDPVYGFIKIPTEFIFDILEHPYVQRLRHIKQLSLSYLVYPGATHNRFQHVLGAMHLMGQAIEIIRTKGHEITDTEAEAVTAAILLHDIGHGPFSHTLEHSLVEDITHEEISLLFMKKLNEHFYGKLSLAIQIFQNKYPKKFLHQLVSSQLDMDRLDYLKRDSFFTGVSEGVISSDRIIKMLNVVNDNLVIESKGIYSVEKFLVARRLMYWQVYLHKTNLAAEQMLIKILKRAKELSQSGTQLFASRALSFFLTNKIKKEHFIDGDSINQETLNMFAMLDDSDLFLSIKSWVDHPDFALSYLCRGLLERKLLKIELSKQAFSKQKIELLKNHISSFYPDKEALKYLIISGIASSKTYKVSDEKINVLFNNGELSDITEASDLFDLSGIARTEKKHFLCYPKEIPI